MNRKNVYWGIIYLSRSHAILRFIIDWVSLFYFKIFRNNKYFYFDSKKYKYFYHIYNRTIASERVIEIPIAKKIIDGYKDRSILEVGNVLSHYFSINHDVLDKYEKGKGVINKDVVDFKPSKKYDLIISVSTLEHVGFSYGEKKDHDKFLLAVERIKKLLVPGGELFATFPIYLNPGIDDLFLNNKMPFNKKFLFKRVSFWNEWVEVNKKEALRGARYEGYYANTNILYIGRYRKKVN